MFNVYNSEENKDDNEKEKLDWDELYKQYGDVEVKVVEDLGTLYQEYVLNKQ